MISLLLDDVTIGFERAESPTGETIHILVAIDSQSAIQVRLPLSPEAARGIAAHLDGRPVVEVARSLPKV